jgi:cytochrome c-type biogenesis protein
LGLLAGLAILAALFAGGLVLIPRYQATHPPSELQRSDADRVRLDDLFLDVTLVTPSFLRTRNLDSYLVDRDPESVLPILVGLNTHTGSIDHMHHLPGEIWLVGTDNRRYPSITEPIVLSQHHNAYMLLFPARDHQGHLHLEKKSGTLAVEAVGMGKTPLRRFEWELPLAAGAEPGMASTLAARLALAVALVSALLVVLSPCALELSLYYVAIISCTVSAGEREAARSVSLEPERAGRRRLFSNLGSFVAGFTLLYAASGATVGFIGEGVRQPMGNYGELFSLVGGALILFFAFRVAGVHLWLRAKLFGGSGHTFPLPSARRDSPGLRAKVRGFVTSMRRRGQSRAAQGMEMRARDSFLVGMGLSSACLSCMGGAVLYPLLVYAGITSWYSGLLTLTLYSLGIALPMLFIALGFFRIRLSLGERLGFNRVLRTASAVMLAGIGLLIITGRERVLTDVTFRLLAEVTQWLA